MIPNINKREWTALMEGQLNPRLTSLSLKLKLNSLRMNVKKGKMTVKEGVEALHKYCSAKPQIYAKDIAAIFNR